MHDRGQKPASPGRFSAEVVLPCADLQPTLDFFRDRLGFRLDAIAPADDPAIAVISGHGVRLRLERGADGAPGVLRLRCPDPAAIAGHPHELLAPNGTKVHLVPSDPPLEVPPLRAARVTSRLRDATWVVGRAGMRYRDLVPDRQGGRLVASHIQVPEGGPVPDAVHFHLVHVQLIYCYRGWVRVVYEDQGPPFVLRAGDCVLQPPKIRHRVLEASPGLEVIELGCPAHHETIFDHELVLPTAVHDPDRDFEGQRFVRHEAEHALWQPATRPGFRARDLGIASATRGLASAQVVSPLSSDGPARSMPASSHDAALVLSFLLEGSLTLSCHGETPTSLVAGDAFVLPPGLAHDLAACSADLELLEITLAGAAARLRDAMSRTRTDIGSRSDP